MLRMDKTFLEHLGATEDETFGPIYPILNILFSLFEFQCISASPFLLFSSSRVIGSIG